jgi:hypothetical protein
VVDPQFVTLAPINCEFAPVAVANAQFVEIPG